ncbi:MAG: DUF58 domain-containing protein [Phycisphaerae bacterium]|nr:DUF58 domain-containing protein [Phycisphaerae bacterium]
MAEAVTDYRKYLDPRTLAKIGALDLRARMVVEGFITGMHRSPYKGFSIEFAEHREYVQGDDTRHIDWKVFGRTDKYHLKQYEEETNLQLMLVVDTSESMNYSSMPMSKYEYGISAAAALAYLTLQQQDAVGLTLFDDELRRYFKPSNYPTYWKQLIHEMDGATGPRKTSIRRVLDDLAERMARRGLVAIFSDLFDDPIEILAGIKHLRYRRHEVIVFQVLDPLERTFPFKQTTMFEGLEQFPEILTEPRALRARYLEEVERFTTQIKRGCRDMGVDYHLLDTGDRLDVTLSSFLASRSAAIQKYKRG